MVLTCLQSAVRYSDSDSCASQSFLFFLLLQNRFTNSSCETTSDWCQIEHWTTLVCLLLGGVFQTVLVAWMISIHQTVNLASRSFEEKLNQLDGYMKSKKLPVSMREKIVEHFHQQHPNRRYFDNERVERELMSPLHLQEMKCVLAREVLQKVPLLSAPENKSFAKVLATLLKPRLVFANELIFQARTTGDTMWFISSGLVELFLSSSLPKDDPYLVIGDGCVSVSFAAVCFCVLFAAVAVADICCSCLMIASHVQQFFGEVSLLLGVKRTTSARAKTQCLLHEIGKQELTSILNDFPHVAWRMKQVATKRRKRLQHCTNPLECSLDPQDELDSEDRTTELFGKVSGGGAGQDPRNNFEEN